MGIPRLTTQFTDLTFVFDMQICQRREEKDVPRDHDTEFAFISQYTEVVLLSCCLDCPSCLDHLNSIGWAAQAAWAAIKKYCQR